jgi:pimeloyl-ACP methyl ester carboxylesterase
MMTDYHHKDADEFYQPTEEELMKRGQSTNSLALELSHSVRVLKGWQTWFITLALGLILVSATLVQAQTDNDTKGAATQTVTSKDGTTIAYDKLGEGPAVILVSGGLGYRTSPMFTQLADLLSQQFTVFNYDRRGRGDSGDTLPYAVEREIEDIEALIDVAGGSAFVYGISSGAVLALEAASKLPTKITKLALYEPPFILDDSRPPLPEDFVEQINEFVASGKRGDAVELFMTHLGVPAEYVAQMRNDPSWADMEKVAHTLAYDGIIVGNTQSGKPLESAVIERWTAATMPTLVMSGANSEAFFHSAAQTLVDILPDAKFQMLEGQDHNVAPDALAPVLAEFF